MSPVRVFIATTAGLVAVQRITEEDPEVNSVVCLAGKAVALPISAAYEAFVRDPTGVIQRHFGHPAFRVDVSATVDEGYSWQLGLFCAHALVKADRLAHPDSDVPLTVIATGEVNRDLHVLGVDHIAEKFDTIAEQLAAIDADPERTVLAVPQANAQAVAGHLEGSDPAPRLLAVSHAGELLDHLGVPLTSAAPPAPPAAAEPEPAGRSRTGQAVALIALIVLFAAGAGAVGVNYSPQLKKWAAKWIPGLTEPAPAETAALPEPKPAPAETPTAPKPAPEPPPTEPVAKPAPPKQEPAATPPPPDPIMDDVRKTAAPEQTDVIQTARRQDLPKDPVRLEILERRAPPGYSCSDVRAGAAVAEIHAAEPKGPFAFAPSAMENLCTVEIKATANVDGLYLFGRYQRWAKSRPGKGEPDKTIDLGPRRDRVHWSVDIPERMSRGASFQVLVFSSWNNFNVPKRLLARIGSKPRSPEARKAVKRLKKRGIALRATRFRVVPESRLNRLPDPHNQSRLQNSGG